MLPRIEQLDFTGPDNLLFGRGMIEETGGFCAKNGEKTLIVTDPGIRDADLINPVTLSLSEANVTYEVFDGVEPDPKISNAITCANCAHDIGANTLIGVGGGSSMDVAKIASVILTNDVSIGDLLGRQNVPKAGVPTVLIPTTTGTGSEVSPAAVLFDDRESDTHEKEAIIDHCLFAEMAIVDPDLSMHLPVEITKISGLDAFAHAIGSYMATTSNTFADTLCVGAMDLIEMHLRDATFHGANAPVAREKMALAAMMAMLGRVNGGKAAIHSIAYGIQAMYDIPHAEAISMILPEVVEYNQPAAIEAFARLGTQLYDATGGRRERSQTLVDGVYRLRSDLGLGQTLTSIGASKGDLDELTDLATRSERHLNPNPRPIDRSDAKTILQRIW